ncbi:hypothetical protein BBB03_01140 [Candidatus Portiera aleyrodidarum]|nr:hypothetical protein BBB03_01140 [Candidatus Portiera aleyrodidarum]
MKKIYCSFCEKPQAEVKKFIAGKSIYICNECIDLCNEVFKEETRNVEFEFVLPKPKIFYNCLDKYIIGQKRAKLVLSVAV